MAVVNAEMKFRVIFGAVGSFADTFEDKSRPGIDGQRFKFKGKRGKRVSVRGRSFYINKAQAELAKAAYEAQQGSEVRLIETNTDDFSNRQVFVFNVESSEPKRIEHSDGVSIYILDVTLDVQRTL